MDIQVLPHSLWRAATSHNLFEKVFATKDEALDFVKNITLYIRDKDSKVEEVLPYELANPIEEDIAITTLESNKNQVNKLLDQLEKDEVIKSYTLIFQDEKRGISCSNWWYIYNNNIYKIDQKISILISAMKQWRG